MTATRYDSQFVDIEPLEVFQADMEECGGGDYVTYSDYEDLASDYERLKNRYDKLLGKLVDLYQEG